MKGKYSYYFLLMCICLLWLSCANIVSPTGGPKDEKPPEIKKRSMLDSSVNFHGGKIEFDFDEFVQLKDIQNQLIVTPLLKTNPKVTVHKKRVTIHIDDSLLEKNTTYTLSMGNAISDLKEGNPYKNLNFTFSTGSYFDSLSLHGRVIEAGTGKPDTSCMVLLYPANLPDSAFYSQKPLYVQRTESGNFFFKNLPEKNFTIYALADGNKNLRYDVASERIAFYDKKVNPKDSADITLYSFTEQQKTDTSSVKKAFIQKAAPAADKKQSSKLNYSVNADTINKTKRTFDINDSLRIRFDYEIKTIDETKIRIFQGDELDASAIVKPDSSKKIIIISTQWSEDAVYNIKLLKGFAQDSSGLQAGAADFSFRTKRKSDYGFLTVHYKNDENVIIELLQNEKVIARKNANDTTVSFPLLNPDNYLVRVLHDENKNGIWDSGSFWKEKHQPELVELYNTPITIKANWENKIDLIPALTKKPNVKKQ